MTSNERRVDSKYVIIIRHGELENPGHISYNRDSIMKSEDVVHLSAQGREQMRTLGKLIKQKGFNVKIILVSPETRGQESAKYLTSVGSFPQIETEEGLDEIFAPGPYLMGLKTDQIDSLKGNVYEGPQWKSYNHEMPESVAGRMRKVFNGLVRELKTGESGVLISHGDPIGWLLNDLLTGHLPKPGDLRDSFYPDKGTGFVVVLNSKNEVKNYYQLVLK